MIEKIGQKIMVGFYGTSPNDVEVKQIIKLAEKGLIGGVILFGYNIKSKEQVRTLINALKAKTKYPLIVAIDQEGGKVQRLRFTDYKSAYDVANSMSPQEARSYYAEMAAELKDCGFNCNFGPVVDLHLENSSAIGKLKRAFCHKADTITKYATAFIKGHHEHGIITSLKHYPGHGLAQKDSHKGIVDITDSHDVKERIPFQELVGKRFNDMVMVGHLMHRDIDATYPTSLSKAFITDRLRNEDNFQGIVITDDLHMGAIQSQFGFQDTILKAVDAGVDILMFSNNMEANQSNNKFDPDNLLAIKIIKVINNALKSGKLNLEQIDESFQRIIRLKKKISS